MSDRLHGIIDLLINLVATLGERVSLLEKEVRELRATEQPTEEGSDLVCSSDTEGGECDH